VTDQEKKNLLERIKRIKVDSLHGQLPIKVRKCPCRQSGCSTYFTTLQTGALNGFSREEAEVLALLLNNAEEILT
jgi:hypothetical protein